jgi:hypothetical protein
LKLFSKLDEANRRRFAGQKALELGHGGMKKIHKLTKLSYKTIKKGMVELISEKIDETRIRKKGGGRKKITETCPQIKKTLEKIMDDNVAGDPMSNLKWTTKSSRNIKKELNKKGFPISHQTTCVLLKEDNFSLKSNYKSKEGEGSPFRDSQFRNINKTVGKFKKEKEPVISVDAKKKENVGNFKNPGKIWSKVKEFVKVNAYDFFSLAKGKAIPYGTYDIEKNTGFVNVGMSGNTGEFAVESIKKWWQEDGNENYPNAKKLLITADNGGGNGSSNKLWKVSLQKFSNETGLKITVCHFPSGTSKWNKIEHRMFSFISLNWKGKPLISYEFIINLICGTKTDKGLKIKASLDENIYKTGIEVPKEEIDNLNIKYDFIEENFPKWNYTISPQK